MQPTDAQRLAARFPPPKTRHVMLQHWSELLFLHWHYPVDTLQALLPAGLSIDTFDDQAFVGVVPFFMSGVRPRFLPAVPWLSRFQELNVRTYVYDQDGHPGVWFFTLDAANPIAVRLAKTFFHLPYRHAQMTSAGPDPIHYSSTPPSGLASHFTYPRPDAGIEASPGSLEFFLLERYFLFAHDARRDRLYRGQVAHSPYRYQLDKAQQWSSVVIADAGLPAPNAPPCHQAIASKVEVRVFPLQRLH